jgi:crotonobetainyl-CoA:carnitine CoA-transferase CaiB-like acyl-CoA transferase
MRTMLLDGVRVVELGSAWAGPFAARLMADLGAEVIKVEAPRRPDMVRFSVYLDDDPGDEPWERGAHYQKFSRNKKSCIIDVGQPKGLELFTRLLEQADILIENNTPRTMSQLGLTREYFESRLPNLIVVSMPGFGSSGPYRDYLAYGLTIEGFAGLSSVTGYADEGMPLRSTIPYGDPVAASYGTLSALAALRRLRKTGKGGTVELSQHETLAALLPELFARAQLEGRSPSPAGNDDALFYAPHGTFPCAGDDTYVALAVETDDQWQSLCDLIGRPDLAPRSGHQERDGFAVREAIAVWTSSRSRGRRREGISGCGYSRRPGALYRGDVRTRTGHSPRRLRTCRPPAIPHGPLRSRALSLSRRRDRRRFPRPALRGTQP